MVARPTSHISEHTAEYIVIPETRRLLSTYFDDVVPLYFWLSREGGRLAGDVHHSDLFRSIALFPRRPKFLNPRDTKIRTTMNEDVMTTATRFRENGVVSIAVCPLVRSFWDIQNRVSCLFVKLGKDTASTYTTDVETGIAGPPEGQISSGRELHEYVSEGSRELRLVELTSAIRESRTRPGPGGGYFSYSYAALYKPTILLLR